MGFVTLIMLVQGRDMIVYVMVADNIHPCSHFRVTSWLGSMVVLFKGF